MMHELFELMDQLHGPYSTVRWRIEYNRRHPDNPATQYEITACLNSMKKSDTYKDLIFQPRRGWYGTVPNAAEIEKMVANSAPRRRTIKPNASRSRALIFQRQLLALAVAVLDDDLDHLPNRTIRKLEPIIKDELLKRGISWEHDFQEATVQRKLLLRKLSAYV